MGKNPGAEKRENTLCHYQSIKRRWAHKEDQIQSCISGFGYLEPLDLFNNSHDRF